jgi:hypothetical protein
LLTRLGDRYGGMAGPVVHDFVGIRGQVLDFGDQWDPSIVELYERHSVNNPWLAVMWREPPGTLIVGSEVHDLERAESPLLAPFQRNFLETLDLFRGIGAVLWDDAFPAPRWCVVVAVLRPNSAGPYSAPEIAAFEDLIPFMSQAIRRHACVEALTRGRAGDLSQLT